MYSDAKEMVADIKSSNEAMFKAYAERNTTSINDAVNRQFQHAAQYHSFAFEDDARIFTGKCRIFNLFGYNKKTSDLYLQIFDRGAINQAVEEGATPDLVIVAAAQSNFSMGLNHVPWFCSRGLYVCLSTTASTKTINTSADGWFGAQFLHEGAGLLI